MTDLSHTQLGQYQLTELIRRGGMSMVYKAYQPELDRYVAVKVLMPMEDPQFASRFKREARAIAHLQHPNICPIYGYGEQDGLLYLVLQYVEHGLTLGDMLHKPMDVIPALQLTYRVLDALDYAHNRSIVHRDIKPGNILMPAPNWPMLADFGIAKIQNESQQFTLVGTIIGTAAYISPEQAMGRPVDARTDVYSMGVVLFEMLTGEIPFDGDSPMAVSMKHAYEQPPSPRQFIPDLPAAAEAVVLRALSKDPRQRYQSAAEMATEIGRIIGRLEQAKFHGEVVSLYKTGTEALAAGRWDLAVERLTQLVGIDPTYEDATELLEAAREQQLQASAAAYAPYGNGSYPGNKRTPVPQVSTGQTVLLPPWTELQKAVGGAGDASTPVSEPTRVIGPAQAGSAKQPVPEIQNPRPEAAHAPAATIAGSRYVWLFGLCMVLLVAILVLVFVL